MSSYQRVNWKNTPETPTDAEHFNIMDDGIDKLYKNVSNQNLFINGHFQIWSNGESFQVQNKNTEVVTPAITADKWYVESVDSTDVLYANEVNDGIAIASNTTQNCKIYQVLDEETYNAIKWKTLTLSYEYEQPYSAEDTSVYYKTQRVAKQIVATESDALTFARNNAIELTVGNIGGAGITIHYVKLEVGELDTPCVPDSKDVLICKLEKNMQPQFAYLYLSASVFVNSGTAIPFDNYITQGDTFSVSNGIVTVEKDVQYVRINATVGGSSKDNRVWMRIHRNGGAVYGMLNVGSYAAAVAGTIVPAKKGDIFSVVTNEDLSARDGGVGCYFDIEKIC